MMSPMELPVLVVTTLASEAEAKALAQALVERRLAACAQINPIHSVYRWQGAVQSDAEWRLLLKTSAARLPALMAELRALHPYELPAIHAVQTLAADAAYADWVDESTRP
jgi:periplasmic divalent cation tolerance protein